MIDKILQRHFQHVPVAESARVSKPVTAVRTRKMNRRALSECVSVTAHSVRVARAENARLKDKFKTTYFVASGEVKTIGDIKQKVTSTASEIWKKIEKFIDLMISAVTEFTKGIITAEGRYNKNKGRIAKAVEAATEVKELKVPKLTDLSALRPEYDVMGVLLDIRNTTKGKTFDVEKFNESVETAKKEMDPYIKAVKEMSKESQTLKSVAEVKKYFKLLEALEKDTVDNSANMKDLKRELKLLKASALAHKKYGDADEVEIAKNELKGITESLTLLNKFGAHTFVKWGILYKALGALDKGLGKKKAEPKK